MGWTYPYGARREDVIRELTKRSEWTRESDKAKVTRTCLAKTYKGAPYAGILYAAMEVRVVRPDGTEMPQRYILVAALHYAKEICGGSWGYKDMDETMGPYATGCPLSYFDLVPFSSYFLADEGPHWQRLDGEWEGLVGGKWVESKPSWLYARDFRLRTIAAHRRSVEKARATREHRKAFAGR